MKFFEFLQKGLSEDNGNPSQRRINVFLACTLFTIGIFIAEIVVILNVAGGCGQFGSPGKHGVHPGVPGTH